MHGVRPKKFLGQHFLKDQNIAQKIANSISMELEQSPILEIGPGTGVLTKFLSQKSFPKIILIEIDHESIVYLN